MAVISKELVPAKQLEAVPTKQYTSESVTTTVDKCTVTNTGAVNATVSIYLVASGGTEGAGNQIIKTRAISPNQTYLCPEIVGQTLDSGTSLSASASIATTLTIRVGGREIS